MAPTMTNSHRFSGLLIFCLFAGCGGTTAPESAAARPTPKPKPFVPPVASIEPRPEALASSPAVDENPTSQSERTDQRLEDDADEPPADTAPVSISELEEGSSEWLVREITRLRTAPTNVVRQSDPKNPEQSQLINLDEEQAERERIRRQYRIIDLAQQVVAKTHSSTADAQLFNNAVHYLADARMQLALAGEPEQAQKLSEDADALYERDPTSFAAVESAYKIVRLAQTMAQQRAADDLALAIAFARQARLFAEKFPQETSRAALNLIAAGRICDNLGMLEEAMSCLRVVEEKYGDTPFADQIAGSMRRLRLPGHQLEEFAGSTHDGGFVSTEDLQGRVLLVAFWASNSEHFRRDLPVIEQILEASGEDVTAIGVNLDRDEFAIDWFLEETGNSWKHIFFSDPAQRGAKNLLARYYGVTKVPTYWVVDAQGTVRAVDAEVSELQPLLEESLGTPGAGE